MMCCALYCVCAPSSIIESSYLKVDSLLNMKKRNAVQIKECIQFSRGILIFESRYYWMTCLYLLHFYVDQINCLDKKSESYVNIVYSDFSLDNAL